jgi:hypothetical protein
MYHCIEENVQKVILNEKASEYFDKECKENIPSELYLNLADLPFYFIVTSTPDKMIVEALKKKNKTPIIARYNFAGTSSSMVQIERASDKTPLIFYLYGVSDEPESLVLTEEDLLDYIVSVVSDNPPIPDGILKELRKEQKSFLFLGFGLKHWYLRILLHVLRGKNKESYSIAFENLVPTVTEELEKTVLFYRKSDYNIKICSDDICKFVEELKMRFETSDKPGKADEKTEEKYLVEGKVEAPSVFICHASEDTDFAKRVSKALKDSGLNPWLDKEILAGGDNWNLVLKEKINQCQYFVVLLSEALINKTTADMKYVNKEITLALERQKEIPPFSRLRFIIPVKIEKSDLIEEIPEIQSIDLSDKDNFDQIVQTINEDYQRRFKRKKQLSKR